MKRIRMEITGYFDIPDDMELTDADMCMVSISDDWRLIFDGEIAGGKLKQDLLFTSAYLEEIP